ncbi:MAG: sigma-54 dependent transcriptional regulator [Candidatus Hydrogenedentota bacterium]
MATMRILIMGDAAVEASREIRTPNNNKFWAVCSSNVQDSLDLLAEGSFDTILLSEYVEGQAALEIATSIRLHNSEAPIIILGQQQETHHRIEGICYIPTESTGPLLTSLIELNARCHNLQVQNTELRKSMDRKRNEALSTINIQSMRPEIHPGRGPALVGSSEAIQKLRHEIEEVAATDMSVMILGETGTGKDVIARSLHHVGNKKGEYVKICCPALPEQLLESELFGHESGAFTGAIGQKPGRLELAMNGSVFLDEITEMPPYIQAKLLEVLESKTFMRVGSTKPIEVKLSFYAASNVPLEDLFDKKGFRRDLYYRLNQYSIELPPLRKRLEDVPELSRHFLAMYGGNYGQSDLTISPKFMDRLTQHSWPGNIRELESVIRKYALTRHDDVLLRHAEGDVSQSKSDGPKVALIKENECELIRTALEQSQWNRRKAAKMLGMSYNTLRRRIAMYSLT